MASDTMTHPQYFTDISSLYDIQLTKFFDDVLNHYDELNEHTVKLNIHSMTRLVKQSDIIPAQKEIIKNHIKGANVILAKMKTNKSNPGVLAVSLFKSEGISRLGFSPTRYIENLNLTIQVLQICGNDDSANQSTPLLIMGVDVIDGIVLRVLLPSSEKSYYKSSPVVCLFRY